MATVAALLVSVVIPVRIGVLGGMVLALAMPLATVSASTRRVSASLSTRRASASPSTGRVTVTFGREILFVFVFFFLILFVGIFVAPPFVVRLSGAGVFLVARVIGDSAVVGATGILTVAGVVPNHTTVAATGPLHIA